jgi:hypothetical protein
MIFAKKLFPKFCWRKKENLGPGLFQEKDVIKKTGFCLISFGQVNTFEYLA